MNRRLYVVAGLSISLVGSLMGFLLILANYQIAIPNPNAVWMVMTLLMINIFVNACAWMFAMAWWLEKEDSYDYYRKLRR